VSARVSLWRIASETPAYNAVDVSGMGAKTSGGRWNMIGTPMLYASTSRALACLETMVHLAGTRTLPLNRYLVEITVPRDLWDAREVFPVHEHPAWDALPAGRTSIAWGSAWATSARTLLADVPSVIVPEESNVLINPRHASAADITAVVRRRWAYDGRMGQ
jgi:RES domain-containing protein